MKTIKSTWIYKEKGKQRVERKKIEMEIDGDILHFVGGPNKVESFYVEDLKVTKGKYFFLYGGNITCYIRTASIRAYISEEN